MKRIIILVPHDAVMASIVDARTMFTGANDFLRQRGEAPLFDVQLVGLTPEVRLNGGPFTVHADATLEDAERPDLVIVPAIGGDLAGSVQQNSAFLPWIVTQYRNGAEVASLCIGAFLLAATGLLNGRECSSHWLTAREFRAMFPEVTLVDGRIVTEQDGLYSSGGATSYWSLLLHLVEKYAGRTIAITAAKIYALEIDRHTQSPFVMFQGQKQHEDEPIRRAQDFIEQNLGERISVQDLAAQFAIGRRHFERRFKKATSNSPLEYMQRVRVEAAKKAFESSGKNVNEVMYDVGYIDPKAFRTTFKKLTGLSPVEYRNKYNRTNAQLMC